MSGENYLTKNWEQIPKSAGIKEGPGDSSLF